MFFKNFFQFLPALAQMPFHGARRDLQLFDDSGDGIALDIEKAANDPGSGRQMIQQFINLFRFERTERIIAGVGLDTRQGFGTLRNADRQPELIDGRIADDRIDPVKESSLTGVVRIDMFIHFQHPVVNGFPGLVIILEKTLAQAKQCREELFIQFFLAQPVIPPATAYDLLFLKFFQALPYLSYKTPGSTDPGMVLLMQVQAILPLSAMAIWSLPMYRAN